MPSGLHFTHPLNRNGRLAAPIDALGFCGSDARLLPLADERALHLGHHAQHGHEDRSRRILSRAERTLFARSVLSSGLVLITLAMTNGRIVRILRRPRPPLDLWVGMVGTR